jgi:predicted nucleic acid-binding protein
VINNEYNKRGDIQVKSSIWEYIDLTVKEKDELWNNGVFVFDTNVLLNLYRCSKKTSEALINALEKLSERIWIPHQVAYEFMKNRCKVIIDVCIKYEEFENIKKTFLDQAKSLSNMRDVDPEIVELEKYIDTWIKDTERNNLVVTNPSSDSVLSTILKLFNGKAGEEYSHVKTKELIKEGEERYKKNIPSGYKDAKKANNDCDNNAYGDFFVWNQIINYAKNSNKDIIFVTADQKEDWWYRYKGKTVSPRIELRKEFKDKSKQEFYMYSMYNFMELFDEKYNYLNNKSVIDELTKLSDEPIFDSNSLSEYNKRKSRFLELITKSVNDQDYVKQYIDYFKLDNMSDNRESLRTNEEEINTEGNE